MDPTEREDSSTYQSRQESGEPKFDRPVEPTRQPEPPKKKSKATGALAVLLLLALVGAGILGWLWYQESVNTKTTRDNLATAEKKVAQLERAATETESKSSESDLEINATSTESEMIVASALAYANAEKDASGVNAKLEKQVGDFARVSITTSGPGYAVLVKKSNDIWVVITSAQGPLPQEVIDRYGIPEEVMKS